jgi:hypothetical protein
MNDLPIDWLISEMPLGDWHITGRPISDRSLSDMPLRNRRLNDRLIRDRPISDTPINDRLIRLCLWERTCLSEVVAFRKKSIDCLPIPRARGRDMMCILSQAR